MLSKRLSFHQLNLYNGKVQRVYFMCLRIDEVMRNDNQTVARRITE